MLTSNSICDEIVFTQNLFVIYPIYCGLKFSINLRIVISIFILNNFWTYPVVVPSFHFNSRIDIEGIQDFFPTILTF